ncbi:unnamed protein product [Symbiodinium sp. CCMP2592]|nr:unnamed protein product [Symbiodinium sp. CCMP2592]
MAHVVPVAKASVVLTLSTCQHPASAHAFSVPIDENMLAHAAAQTLQRASEKLGFRPEDVLDLTTSLHDPLPQEMPSLCVGERCCCGKVETRRDQIAEAIQDLFEDARRQLQASGLRPRVVGVLHVAPRAEVVAAAAPRSTAESEALVAPARQCWQPQQSMDKHELQLRKKSPRSLRQDAQSLWTALEKSKVYIPPVPDTPASYDRFHLERHGHGRGNTKSTKKRRKREDRETLCVALREAALPRRLILHLEQIALEHGVRRSPEEREASDGSLENSSSDSEDSGS